MNLNQLRQYVWNQTDTTALDLPSETIDSYLDEAFNRTIAAESAWPFYQQTWELTVAPGDAGVDLPSDVNLPGVLSVVEQPRGALLEYIGSEEAERRFSTQEYGAGPSRYFSIWNNRLRLWPLSRSDEPREVILRGFRKPLTTFSASTGEVDADGRLHRPLAHYAIALAYAREEDEVLERTYMERWQRDVEMARKAIMESIRNRPVVMHGNWPRTRGRIGSYTPSTIIINPP